MVKDITVFSISGCIIDPRPKPRPSQLLSAAGSLGEGLIVVEHAYAYNKGAPAGEGAPTLALTFRSGLNISIGDYLKKTPVALKPDSEVTIRPADKQLELILGKETFSLYSIGTIDVLSPLESIELLRLGDNSLRLAIRCFGVQTGITFLGAEDGSKKKKTLLKAPQWCVGGTDLSDDVVIQVRAAPSKAPKEEYHAVEVSIAPRMKSAS